MITNYQNYGPFETLIRKGQMKLNTNDITRENYDSYFNGLLNIMRDGIESPEVQNLKVSITLGDGNKINLTVTDTWFQLIFWTFPILVGEPVTAKYFVDTRAITKKTMADYFNMLIKDHTENVNFIVLNNLIDETIYKFKYIDEFALYLANTVNFKDTIDLMERYPEFDKTIHADFTGVPIEDVKNIGMDYARTQIEYIKQNDHCLRDSFISQEAVSDKQFKEVSVNIGTKPDGRGGIYPYIINNSYINGGVSEVESYLIDASVGRTAQIMTKSNVSTSGAFARLLETNNLDTFFNPDPNYVCDTKNFIQVYIKDATWLSIYDKRYYKLDLEGPDYIVDKDRDTHLIGKTLNFRSPITCASYAQGRGICKHCYGNLYYTNMDMNPGKLAAELLSSIYTQMLLSAKHLLEASVIEMKWNSEFYDLFQLELDMICPNDTIDYSGYEMHIYSELIESDEDDDEKDEAGIEYTEYIPYFDIIYPDGNRVRFCTEEEDNIYITKDLNEFLQSKKKSKLKDEDDTYKIPMNALKDLDVIFSVKIQNKELQRTLKRAKQIINKKKDTCSYTKDEIVREFISANMEGKITLNAVHAEVLIANQIRDTEDILEMPKWHLKDAPYQILTLDSALNNSPSITTTLEYQKIGKTLVKPLSSKKRKASVFDLFFMEKPQEFIENNPMISDEYVLTENSENDLITREGLSFDEPQEEDTDDEQECYE
jgi:hypothetical protein